MCRGAPTILLQVNVGRAERRARFLLRLGEQPGRSAGPFTTRMPRPPPPAEAFRITG